MKNHDVLAAGGDSGFRDYIPSTRILAAGAAALGLVAAAFPASSFGAKNRHCTSARWKPNDIYQGYGCAETGDTFNSISGVPQEKGWQFGVFVVNGIYKCSFMRPGVLPEKNSLRPDAKSKCINLRPTMVENPYNHLKKFNCSTRRPCNNATEVPETPWCEVKYAFRNFATDNPSPLNVYGTGEGGFSWRIRNSGREFDIMYRTQVRGSSADGNAIVVRQPKWGFASSTCVEQKDRAKRPF